MAENRTNAEDTGTPVPKARAADDPAAGPPEPDQAADQASGQPARKRGSRSRQSAEPTGTARAKPSKAAKAAKTSAKQATARKSPRAAESGKSGGSGPPEPASEAGETAGKKAGAKRAARKTTRAAPSPAAEPTPASPAGDSAPAEQPLAGRRSAAPGVWAAAAWDALQQSDQPPHRLVELAVAELGPRAADWVGWLRQTYPDPPAYGVARLATRQATRSALALAMVEAGGPATAPLLLPAAGWVRVTVVLRIAAAYGHDPTDPQRVADLIDLFDLDPAAASEPLSGSAGRVRALGGVAAAAGRFGLVRFASRRLRLTRTPAAALRALIAASDHADSVERLAHRAVRYYRTELGGRSSR